MLHASVAISKQCRSLSSSPSASEPPKIQKELGGRKVIEWCCRALKPSPRLGLGLGSGSG